MSVGRPGWMGAAGALAALVIVTALSGTEAWGGLDDRVRALVSRARGPLPWNESVVVVAMDEASFRYLGSPLPRAATATLVNALLSSGARAIGIDVGYQNAPVDGAEGNSAFAGSVRRPRPVVVMVDCAALAVPLSTEERRILGQSAWQLDAVPAVRCGSVNLPAEPVRSFATFAHARIGMSPAGYHDRVYLAADAEGVRLPGLALATWAAGLETPATAPRIEDGVLTFAGREVRFDADGRTRTTWRGLPDEALLSYAELLAAVTPDGVLPEPWASRVAGRWVLVGTTAEVFGDEGPFETGERLPRVAAHAALLSDLIEGRSVRPVSALVNAMIALSAALLVWLASTFLHPRNAVLTFVVVVLGLLHLSARLAAADLVFAPLAASVVAAVTMMSVLVPRAALAERRQRRIVSSLGSYVHPGVLERVLASPDETLALGGARRTVTVLFSDIRGYTERANQLPPERVLDLLRDYMRQMTRIVTAHQGRVDKMMGDGLMAVFGDLVPTDEHPHQALDAALEMQAVVQRLSRAWEETGAGVLTVRIGLATGDVVMGDLGAEGSKLEYTVIGRTVNFAARLETTAMPGEILISDRTRQACDGRASFEEIAGLELKGFEGEQRAWRVVG